MQPRLKKIVLTNLTFITENTCNLNSLIVHLLEKQKLSIEEKELLDANVVSTEKATALMLIFVKKDSTAFRILLEGLYTTQNEHVANLLDEAEKQTLVDDTKLKLEGANREHNADNNADQAASNLTCRQVNIYTNTKSDEQLSFSPATFNNKPINVIIVGDSFTGKSCILNVWQTGKFPVNGLRATAGIDYCKTHIVYNGIILQLNITDTAGTDAYDTIRFSCYEVQDICVIVYAMDNPASLLRVASKWAHEVQKYSTKKKTRIIMVGNKKNISVDNLSEACSQMDVQKPSEVADLINAIGYYEVSAKTGEGMKDVLDGITNTVGEIIPETSRWTTCSLL